MGRWIEIIELEDGNCAVCDGNDHLMLKQPPDLMSVIPKRLEREVREWLFDKEYHYPHLLNILDEETKQEIFKYLLNEEYKKEVLIAP